MKYLVMGTIGLFIIVIFAILVSSAITQDFSLLRIMELNHYFILLIVCLGLGGCPLEDVFLNQGGKDENNA